MEVGATNADQPSMNEEAPRQVEHDGDGGTTRGGQQNATGTDELTGQKPADHEGDAAEREEQQEGGIDHGSDRDDQPDRHDPGQDRPSTHAGTG